MKSKERQSVLILGSYGRGNVGDDAFLLVALDLFKDYNIFINAADDAPLPKAARNRVKTIQTNGLADIHKKVVTFFTVKQIIYFGGDLWVDLHGSRMPRAALYKMLMVNLISRVLGKRVHYLGCGVGSLSSASVKLARLTALIANSVTVRDSRSAQVLNIKKVRTLPDLVSNLPIELTDHKAKRSEKFTIGVSLLYYVPHPEKNFERLIDELAKFLNSLDPDQFSVILFPMLISENEKRDDLWVAKQLAKKVTKLNMTIFEDREVENFTSAVTTIDIMISARLHANILALLVGKPVIGISYRPKVAQFFEANELSDSYLELEALTATSLSKKVNHIRGSYPHTLKRYTEVRDAFIKERVSYQEVIAENF